MSKLDDILLTIPGSVVDTPLLQYKTVHASVVEAKSSIKSLLLSLIDEDEDYDDDERPDPELSENTYTLGKNAHRSEMRKRINEL